MENKCYQQKVERKENGATRFSVIILLMELPILNNGMSHLLNRLDDIFPLCASRLFRSVSQTFKWGRMRVQVLTRIISQRECIGPQGLSWNDVIKITSTYVFC
jgi:hypothetical protein